MECLPTLLFFVSQNQLCYSLSLQIFFNHISLFKFVMKVYLFYYIVKVVIMPGVVFIIENLETKYEIEIVR
jgi:hypothetical protein